MNRGVAIWVFWLLAFVLGAQSGQAGKVARNKSDLSKLRALKKSFDNGNSVLSSWKGQNFCKRWLGVKCNRKKRVIAIKLPNRRLEGELQPWKLPALLKELNLKNNRISGTLSRKWKLPNRIKRVVLQKNWLEGSIPNNWNLPRKLTVLDLSQNNLSGILPTWGKMKKLITMVQPGNDELCGKMPRFPKYRTTKKKAVKLPSCQKTDAELLLGFKASLSSKRAFKGWGESADPCKWFGIKCKGGKVTRISLSAQSLTGRIPAKGWDLPPTLEELDLRGNSVTGTIPAAWKLPSPLKNLYLQTNKLSGSIPPSWELPSGLQELGLTRNQLTGPLPAALTLPSTLTYISINNNTLSGTIPRSWDLPPKLETLEFGSNTLSGGIPPAWDLPPSLTVLDISKNELTGPVPPSWDLPPQLRFLFMEENQLTGTLPTGWNLPSSLVQVEMQGNSFTGPFPSFSLKDESARVIVKPGNEGLCKQGAAPAAAATQKYEYDGYDEGYGYEIDYDDDHLAENLPLCSNLQ